MLPYVTAYRVQRRACLKTFYNKSFLFLISHHSLQIIAIKTLHEFTGFNQVGYTKNYYIYSYPNSLISTIDNHCSLTATIPIPWPHNPSPYKCFHLTNRDRINILLSNLCPGTLSVNLTPTQQNETFIKIKSKQSYTQ